MTARASTRGTLFLTGEVELLGEFAAVCVSAGFGVVSPGATGKTREHLPPGVRRSAAVPGSTVAAVELTNADLAQKRKNLARLDRALPARVPILSSSVTVSAGTQALWIRRPERLIGFGAFPTLMARPLAEVAFPPVTPDRIPAFAGEFFGALGKEISVVQDRVGMVMPRILCALINEACFALTEEVASPRDIDTSMKLGTNYPRGPLEWANLAGIRQVVAVLDALRGDTGEERYRVSPLLRQMASAPGLLK